MLIISIFVDLTPILGLSESRDSLICVLLLILFLEVDAAVEGLFAFVAFGDEV